jgi:hypothetical protein
MANITAASILYGTPVVAKVGDLLFTVTNIEVSSAATEYVEGGIELLPAKLGLTDEAISGAQSVARESGVGAMASTTALAGAIWSAPFLVKAKEQNEAGKEVAGAFPCAVSLVKGVPYLRLYAATTAGQAEPFLEVKAKTAVSLYTTTIFAFGK